MAMAMVGMLDGLDYCMNSVGSFFAEDILVSVAKLQGLWHIGIALRRKGDPKSNNLNRINMI